MSEPTDDGEVCPLDSCGLPYTKMYRDTAMFSLTREKMKAAKVCVIPVDWNGTPATMQVYHTHEDIVEGAEDVDDIEDAPEMVQQMLEEDQEPSHPGDLSGDHETIFELIREATADEGRILLGDLRKAATDEGVEKGKVEPIALNLMYHGFVEQVENAVFKVPAEAVL